jgi:pyruvate kinase
MLLSINFPSWLRPEMIPGLPFRWYGLMYILAFITAFLVYRRQVKERHFPMSDEQLYSLFTWAILGILLGARLFATIVYETSDIYKHQPWLVFWPFRNGQFTGLMGMSYHGGAIGCLLAVILFSKIKHFSFREIGDMFAASVPLGYTFGRLGNFINAELYGRVTTGPMGMVFPYARPLSISEDWVREAADKTGAAITNGWVNLPRHPSQLYEMLFEGVLLWVIIWLFRNRKPFNGFLMGMYFMGYGLFRFFIEYFREPDEDLGYRIELVKSTLSSAYAHPPLSFSTGQILCTLMILFGIIWVIICSRLPNRGPVRVYNLDVASGGEQDDGKADMEKASKRNQRRKLRRKLRSIMTKRKTKIVCSLGPASSSDEVVRNLILAGMNIARLNFSHGSQETHRASIDQVRRISQELGIPVAILLDTKGPEIRTGMVENDGKVTINKGDSVLVSTDDCFTTMAQGQNPARISITWKEAASKLQCGNRILIADGLLELDVLEIAQGVMHCRADNAAIIGSKKNVNLIGVHAGLPILAEQDKEDLAFGVEMDLDFVAASFLSFPHEVIEIRKYLDNLHSNMKIIAKIESNEGLENIKEITHFADGVMVARGDLGVQLPTEQIPLAQKHIIGACRKAGKPVITATQMLESMIVNPRPTRAELTDVANAIFDGTDAVMLSGETASGAYPVEAVKMMDKIAVTVEQSPEFRTRMKNFHDECHSEAHNSRGNLSITMARSGVEIASAIDAKAIVTSTLSGNTARLLSVFRPDEPILAISPDNHARRVMQLYWGVYPHETARADETEGMIQNSIRVASETGVAGISDKILLVAGLPLTSPHMVNTVRVIMLGTVLARSAAGGHADPEIARAKGRVIHAANPYEARDRYMSMGGEILICKTLTEDYTPMIRIVSGVICEGVSEINEERLREINPRLVWLTHVRNASGKLESGLSVTIDAKQLLIYEGIL